MQKGDPFFEEGAHARFLRTNNGSEGGVLADWMNGSTPFCPNPGVDGDVARAAEQFTNLSCRLATEVPHAAEMLVADFVEVVISRAVGVTRTPKVLQALADIPALAIHRPAW